MRYQLHRELKVRFRAAMGTVGHYLPFELKRQLARRSTKLSYLLLDDGDFEVTDYLGDCRVKVNARREIERVIITGTYEPEVIQIIKEWVKPGHHAVDVGANIGAITLALAKQVGHAGRVTSFEPGPPFFERLKHNLAMNPECDRVTQPHCLGVSSQPGQLYWGEDFLFPGNAHLLGTRGTAVPVTSLDLFFGDALDRLDFLKIDVEGMEWEVLKGAEKTLRRFCPIVLFETFPFEGEGNNTTKLSTEFLTALGYRLYRADTQRPLVEATYPHFSSNTIAIPSRLKNVPIYFPAE